ncbi:hypothetical protein RUM44_003838 [Polyplax serrata]|uniref:Uncharacterized protein n=1 Tax=Polyplax serrata TaxID=468196 RepID=A0ABR1B2W6_POLSC
MENPNKKKEKAPHPRETANPCSALTFAELPEDNTQRDTKNKISENTEPIGFLQKIE